MGRDVAMINDAIDHIRAKGGEEATIMVARLIAVRDNLCADRNCEDNCPVGCLRKSELNDIR